MKEECELDSPLLLFLPIFSSVKTHLPAAVAVFSALAWASLPAAEPKSHDWPVYLGGKERNLYSPLAQINRENVHSLKQAWSYNTGQKAEYQANNLIIRGVLYTPTATREIVALDAATGETIWKWDPGQEKTGRGRQRQRGLVYWENEQGEERRLLGSRGPRVVVERRALLVTGRGRGRG